MKMKLDLSQFKMKSKDDKIATLIHPDGHEFRVAIEALNPGNRKNLDALEMHEEAPKMAQGGPVEKEIGKSYDRAKVSPETKKKTAEGMKKAFSGSNGYAKGGEVKDKKKKLEIEKLEHPEPKEHLEYEQMQPKHPVDYEPMMAEGGSVLGQMPQQSGQDMSQSLPQMPNMGQVQPQSPQMPQVQPQTPQEQEVQPESPSVMGGYEKQVQGAQGAAQAQQQQAQGEQQALGQQLQSVNKMMEDYQTHFNELDSERKAFQQDIVDKHIEPQRYMGSMDSTQKFDTAVGLILGGLGGDGHSNAALDFLNKQIDRDIDAQRAEMGKRDTLLSANMRQFGNLKDATEMTKVMMHDTLINKLKIAEAKATNPMAKARAQQEIGKLEQQIAPVVQQLATRKALEQMQSGGGAPQGAASQDPASFVPAVVPEHHQEAVYKEIERAQNTKQVAKNALANFDKVTKDMKAVGGLGRIGVVAYSPAELQALEAELGSTVGDMEGTVRETAMHNVKNAYLPRATDSPARLAERRQELANYLKLKSSAPRAKSFGLDVDKFESTTRQQPEMKTLNGVQYQKVQGGWKRVQ